MTCILSSSMDNYEHPTGRLVLKIQHIIFSCLPLLSPPIRFCVWLKTVFYLWHFSWYHSYLARLAIHSIPYHLITWTWWHQRYYDLASQTGTGLCNVLIANNHYLFLFLKTFLSTYRYMKVSFDSSQWLVAVNVTSGVCSVANLFVSNKYIWSFIPQFSIMNNVREK